MAQMPPKNPAITQNWPSLTHQTTSKYFSTTTSNAPAMENHQPSWVDEFLDFTSSRRGTHRRSISDSIAFIETTNDIPSLAEESCHETVANNNDDDDIDDDDGNNSSPSAALISGNLGFDKLDDDQLMSMFSDDHLTLSLPPSTTSNPSTPSDQNSNNAEKPLIQLDQRFQPQLLRQRQQEEEQQQKRQEEEQQQVPKAEPGEVESSSCEEEPPPPPSPNVEAIVDPKRVKRILANRQSAQRSRVRKLQYISELERSVTTLQTEVSALSPRVAYLDHQRLILSVDNSALKQRIAALAQDKIFKDAHQEALKKEMERLRQVYHQQNLNKMNNHSNLPSPRPQQQQTPTHESIHCTDN